MPKDCEQKRFRVRVFTHQTDYLMTNEVEPHETAAAEQESSVRWTIKPFHRERKQLTGVQACPVQPPLRRQAHRETQRRTVLPNHVFGPGKQRADVLRSD